MSSAVSSSHIDEVLVADLTLSDGTLPHQEPTLIIAFNISWKLLQASQSSVLRAHRLPSAHPQFAISEEEGDGCPRR